MPLDFHDDKFKITPDINPVGAVKDTTTVSPISNQKMDVVEFATQFDIWTANQQYNSSDSNHTVSASAGATSSAPISTPIRTTTSNSTTTHDSAPVASTNTSGQIQGTALPSALKGITNGENAGTQPDYAKMLDDMYKEYSKYMRENKTS